jgi:hypothetical protein
MVLDLLDKETPIESRRSWEIVRPEIATEKTIWGLVVTGGVLGRL